MGILGANEFFKGRGVDYSTEMDLSDLSGRKIALDGGGLFFKSAARIHKSMIYELKCAADDYSPKEFSRRFIEDIMMVIFYFLENNIDVIVIFDGARHPAKDRCREGRQEQREKTKSKAETAIEAYLFAMENPLDQGIDSTTDADLRKIRANDFFFDKSSLVKLKKILDSLGIPNLEAEYEAEALCCSLAEEKKVFAVYTNDTDCYAFGINYMITELNMYRNKIKVTNVKVIIKYFMDEFDCSRENAKKVLKDFCIMCKCDFNVRIPGVGPVTIFRLLKIYKRVHNIPNLDLEPLNYKESKKLLTCFETDVDEETLTFNHRKFINAIDDFHDSCSTNEAQIACFRIKNVLRSK